MLLDSDMERLLSSWYDPSSTGVASRVRATAADRTRGMCTLYRLRSDLRDGERGTAYGYRWAVPERRERRASVLVCEPDETVMHRTPTHHVQVKVLHRL